MYILAMRGIYGEEEVHSAIGKTISNFFCSFVYNKSEVMMKSKILASLFALAFVGFISTASAAVTIKFDSTECPTCTNGSNPTTEWSSFGLTVSNAYWYIDGRDTFDTMGLSIQTSPASISLATASTDATIDYWVIGGNRGIYEAFDSAHNSLGVLPIDASGGDLLGTYTFTGAVSSIEWAGNPGYVQISTLTISPVPEPETYAMLLVGLGLLGFAARRRQQNA